MSDIKLFNKSKGELLINNTYYWDIDRTIYNAIEELIEENEKLKKTLENNSKINIADHKYASATEDKYLIEHNILTEFEKWLEEEVKQYQPYISENMIFKPNLEYEIVKSIYDKLQELKGDC